MCLVLDAEGRDLLEHVHWATAKRQPLQSVDSRIPIVVIMLVGQTWPARFGHNYIAIVQQNERIFGMGSRKQSDTHAAVLRG
jgi:hypothetical protein